MPHVFHDGERAVQERAGVGAIASRVGASIHTAIPPVAQAFLREQPFAVVASRDASGRLWASVVHGAPGFLSTPDAETFEIAAVPSPQDPLAANIAIGARLGTLVIDLATRRRMRMNGRVMRATSPIRVAVDEVFSNCPKYIQKRELVPARPPAPPASLARAADALTTAQQEWVRRADTCFIASGHHDAGLDASHRGGAPGFLTVIGERHLAWPDYAGNSMFQTLGNLALDPRCGLLLVDFSTGYVLQLSGRARVDWDPGRAARLKGAERVVDFVVDAVRETRRALPLRATAVESSPFNP